MSHRLWWVVGAGALLALVPHAAERVAGQDGGLSAHVTPLQGPEAGDWYYLWLSAEGLAAGEARVYVDPLGVGADGFVLRLADQTVWCAKPNPFDCEGCPAGRRCFNQSSTLDARLSAAAAAMDLPLAQV